MNKLKNKSKYLSLLLRHNPSKANLNINSQGWVSVQQLISNTNLSLDDIIQIVKYDNKQRYSFNDNKTYIRANQGHSIDVDLNFEEIKPFNELYHGTTLDVLNVILKDGIKKMSRQYVHLSKDIETAKVVAKRRKNSIILKINTKQMYEDNFKFYLSKNNIWLTDFVPSKYINIEYIKL